MEFHFGEAEAITVLVVSGLIAIFVIGRWWLDHQIKKGVRNIGRIEN